MALKDNYFFRNLFLTVMSNILAALVSVFVNLFLPKILLPMDFGYYQFFIMLAPIFGIFSLGIYDGIYLENGGKLYVDQIQSKNHFSIQFFIFLIFELFICLFLYIIFSLLDVFQYDTIFKLALFIYQFVILAINFHKYFLSSLNEFRKYNRILIIDRLLFLVITIGLILNNVNNYKYYIIAEILSKFFAMVVAIIQSKDIFNIRFLKFSNLKNEVKQTLRYINIGWSLSLAGIISNLIIPSGKSIITAYWGIEVFSKISLAISISNLLTIFASSMNLVLFPIIRRMDYDKQKRSNIFLRKLISSGLFLFIGFYQPIKFVLLDWLPNYTESLNYMALLFPICVFICKADMISIPFMKSLNLQRKIFIINLFSLIFIIIFELLAVVLFESMFFATIAFLLTMIIRSVIFDIYVAQKIIDKKIYTDIIVDIVLTILFVIVNWFMSDWLALFIYALVLLFYLLRNIKDLKHENFLG